MFDRTKILDLLLSLHLNKGSRFQIGKWTVFLISPVHCLDFFNFTLPPTLN
jgi:hypothetical protein